MKNKFQISSLISQITYHCLYALWYLLSLLPFCILYVLSDIVYVIIYKLLGYRVRVVRNNLETSFPEKSTTELRQIERRFYHCLCDYFFETVKMMTISEQHMRRRMVIKGIDIIEQCIDEGQSCAAYLGHVFNWEWLTSMPLWATPKAHCGQLYHALESKVFDRLFLSVRQRWGAECIPLVDILRKTVEYKRKQQPTVIGYIGDQVPHWNNIHHWCQFLNHDTPVMTGTERIALKNRQALIYFDISRLKRGYYEMEVKLITRHPEELKEFQATDIYYRMLEDTIRRQPELWLWSHNRWKRTREEFNRRFQVVDGKVVPKTQ